MHNTHAHEEINEAHFTYLLLARQMILEDREAAIHCLGISREMAERFASMNPAQLLRSPADMCNLTV